MDIALNGKTIDEAIKELEWYKVKFGGEAILSISSNYMDGVTCEILKNN